MAAMVESGRLPRRLQFQAASMKKSIRPDLVWREVAVLGR